jgi:hypothetical protein
MLWNADAPSVPFAKSRRQALGRAFAPGTGLQSRSKARFNPAGGRDYNGGGNPLMGRD